MLTSYTTCLLQCLDWIQLQLRPNVHRIHNSTLVPFVVLFSPIQTLPKWDGPQLSPSADKAHAAHAARAALRHAHWDHAHCAPVQGSMLYTGKHSQLPNLIDRHLLFSWLYPVYLPELPCLLGRG